MQNRCADAIDKVNSMDAAMPRSAPPWVKQVWRLFKADVLYVSKKQGIARQVAGSTISEIQLDPSDLAFAGMLARWWTITGEADAQRDALLALIGRLDDLDLLDQVEVLAACGQAGIGDVYLDEAKRRLAWLPSAVRVQLTYLGLLSPSRAEVA